MHWYQIKAVLLGGNSDFTVQGLLGAVGVFVVGLGLWGLLWVVITLDVQLSIDFYWLLGALATMSIAPAGFYAYKNDGLAVCWALGTALPLALYLVPTVSETMAPDESVFWALWGGLLFGIPAGTIGFLLGVGTRHLTRERRVEVTD